MGYSLWGCKESGTTEQLMLTYLIPYAVYAKGEYSWIEPIQQALLLSSCLTESIPAATAKSLQSCLTLCNPIPGLQEHWSGLPFPSPESITRER